MADALNMRIYEGAEVFAAPKGTTAPVDLDTPLPAEWLSLGGIAVDSGEQSMDSDSTDFEMRGPSGTFVARTVVKYKKRSFTVDCMEKNYNVLAVSEPDTTVTTATGVNTIVHRQTSKNNEWAICVVVSDGDQKARETFQRGMVSVASPPRKFGSEPAVMGLEVTVYYADDGTYSTELNNNTAEAAV